jgi:hypothetical protein
MNFEIAKPKLDAIRIACDLIEMTADDSAVTSFEMQLALRTLQEATAAFASDTLHKMLKHTWQPPTRQLDK